jgi:DHA2 family multidrug resistance protein-like MFS transporter
VAIYRGRLTEALPADVPVGAAEAARDTLGGALAVAEQLPGQLGSAVIDLARDAFVQGMQVATMISATLAVGIAILAVVMLRNVGSGAEREAAADADREAAAGADRAKSGERAHRPALDASA